MWLRTAVRIPGPWPVSSKATKSGGRVRGRCREGHWRGSGAICHTRCFVTLAGLLRYCGVVTRGACGIQVRRWVLVTMPVLGTASLWGWQWNLGRPSRGRQKDGTVIESPSWEQSESVRWDQGLQFMSPDSKEHVRTSKSVQQLDKSARSTSIIKSLRESSKEKREGLP